MMVSATAQAYPEFIAYGYTSCLTCHNNGMGHGSLNDYGRALFSSEIASRAVFPNKWSNDDVAKTSGFLGSTEIPWWVRPYVKYRSLNNQTKPGSPASETKFYQMQSDIGATFMFDQDANYLLDLTYGQVTPNEAARRGQISAADAASRGSSGVYLLRQYFLRAQPVESWWIYIGLMDKVFGIRNVDHTSYQRSTLGLTQYAQSDGIIVQKVGEKYEATFNAFNGNSKVVDQTQEQKGYSLMSEYEPVEKMRIGGSLLTSSSTVNKLTALGLHYRQGLKKGNSLMAEAGVVQTEATAAPKLNGQYMMVQTMFLMTRGYHLESFIEKSNRDTLTIQPDRWRYGVGVLAFPAPRLELRFGFIDYRAVSQSSTNQDDWVIQGQLHVSL